MSIGCCRPATSYGIHSLHICLIIDCYEITLQWCPRALLWLGHFGWVAPVGAVFLRGLRPFQKFEIVPI